MNADELKKLTTESLDHLSAAVAEVGTANA